MSRKPEIENPVRLSSWIPELTKVTLVAIKYRLGLDSVGKTITRLAMERGTQLEITDEELKIAREDLES